MTLLAERLPGHLALALVDKTFEFAYDAIVIELFCLCQSIFCDLLARLFVSIQVDNGFRESIGIIKGHAYVTLFVNPSEDILVVRYNGQSTCHCFTYGQPPAY